MGFVLACRHEERDGTETQGRLLESRIPSISSWSLVCWYFVAVCVCVLVFGSWLVLGDVSAWVCVRVCCSCVFVAVALCLFVATKELN